MTSLLSAGVLAFAVEASAADGGWPTIDSGGGGDAANSPDGSTITPGAILAYYCGDAEMMCTTAPIAFEKTIELPIAFDWDTGWIPKNFDELQVRFFVKIPAETTVKLAGHFQTTWPSALTLATPGSRFGGFLGFDYGLMVGGQYKIDVSLLGIHYKHTGDLPYFPQIDFHLLGMQAFDSWAYDPVSASAFTAQFTVFKINILGLTGIPSWLGEAGLELAVQGELRAEYQTLKMVVEPSVAPITSQGGTTFHGYAGGPFVEYDVHPEGKVHYDGVIHLIPKFYVEVVGQNFAIPLYDFPYAISLYDQDFVFDDVRVHVPLPDIPEYENKVFDFGKVDVGSGKKQGFLVPNMGEGKARAVVAVEGEGAKSFKVLSPSVYVDPGDTGEIVVRFTPDKPGPITAKLVLASNDPDLPTQTLELRGNAVDPDMPDYGDEDAGGSDGPGSDEQPAAAAPGPGDEGGCACRIQSRNVDIQYSASLLAAAVVAAAARRRRRYLV